MLVGSSLAVAGGSVPCNFSDPPLSTVLDVSLASRRPLALAILALLLLAGCGGDDSNGPNSGGMAKSAGDNASGFAGNFTPSLPVVQLRDGGGNPIANAAVNFTVATGGGSVSFPAATTDDSGRASPGAWRFGPAGTQGLTAAAEGHASVTFAATATAPPASQFKIDIVFLDPQPSDSQKAAFLAARDRWQQLIVGDLNDYGPGFAANEPCAGFDTPVVDGPIDDVVIFAAVRPIPADGGANILAQAGPCSLRASNLLTIAGIMIFDSDDIATLTAGASLADVATHEMGHVLGFGLIWSDKHLITNEGGTDPYFTGAGALQAFRAAQNAVPFAGNPVPVENSGGAGTRDGHWRETTFGRELMTGFYNANVANPLSAVTTASMRDLGYLVDDSRSDAYLLPLSLGAFAAARPMLEGREQLAPWPIRVTDERGRMQRVLSR